MEKYLLFILGALMLSAKKVKASTVDLPIESVSLILQDILATSTHQMSI